MAGGDGTRLRPMTVDYPKPMVKLAERPVLQDILRLLKKSGIDEACLTLRYMPEHITGFFGEGESLGMKLSYNIETQPLGTAGSVRACADFLGGEDFIVISGDAVCNFDLARCIDSHRRLGAEATLVLYAHPDPLEYGVVLTDPGGKILQFIEKPPWDKVVTDLVNTGIYILSPSVFKDIPENTSFDFSRDLFPKLLREGRALYGVIAEGYWCDIGSPEAYLRCSGDMLDGATGFLPDAPLVRPGVWSHSPSVPPDSITPPVYIGKNVSVGKAAHIGPYTVLCDGSSVGDDAFICGSVIDGAHIAAHGEVHGAYIGPASHMGEKTVVGEMCVIGSGVILGDGCRVDDGVRIWPRKDIPAGTHVRENLSSGMLRSDVSFSGEGKISGEFNVTVTPEVCFALGSAMASLGERVGVMCAGGSAARCSADAVLCGVRSAGSVGIEIDASFSSCASHASYQLSLPLSVIVSQDGGAVELEFFNNLGLHPSRGTERKIESSVSVSFPRAGAEKVGSLTLFTGAADSYAAAAAQNTRIKGLNVSVPGRGAANRALRAALTAAGCLVTEPYSGVPRLECSPDGFSLLLTDEDGREISGEKSYMLALLCALKSGEKSFAMSFAAPYTAEEMAGAFGASVMRLERDGEAAEKLYASQRFLWDAAFAAVRICRFMSENSLSMRELAAELPAHFSGRREVTLSHGRGAIMRAMAENFAEMAEDFSSGLRIGTEKGVVHISPCRGREALIISGEGRSAEIAEELCADFAKRVEAADKNG